MFIQYQYKLQLHQSGRATIEARSKVAYCRVVGLTQGSRQQKITLMNGILSRGLRLSPPAYQSKRLRVSVSSPVSSKSLSPPERVEKGRSDSS